MWRHLRQLLLALVLGGLLVFPSRAEAFELWSSDDGLQLIELNPSLKLFFFGTTGFLQIPPELLEGFGLSADDQLYPNVGGGMLGRLRLRFLADITPRIRFIVHYEHRPRVLSHGRLLSAASSSLQGDEGVPLRITPLLWTIASSDVVGDVFDDLAAAGGESGGVLSSPSSSTFAWDHEIDRLLFAFSLPRVDITIGRQGVGWGLGRLWSPLDLFAPLTATDLDREERRGIDALRLTFPFSPTALMEVVAAAGTRVDDDGDQVPAWSRSALAWMLRFSIWDIEWMLMAGKVGPDEVVGGAISGQIRGVGVRGEISATTVEGRRTYDPDDEDVLVGFDPSRDETNLRATVGVEFGTSFNLSCVIEYHYNGFGELHTGNYLTMAFNQDLASRLARGVVSGFAQHYAGVVLAYAPLPSFSASLVYIQNLQDGSLILGPAIEYVITDEVRLSFSAFIPIGRDPEWNTTSLDPTELVSLRSEYGMSAQLYVLSLRASL